MTKTTPAERNNLERNNNAYTVLIHGNDFSLKEFDVHYLGFLNLVHTSYKFE